MNGNAIKLTDKIVWSAFLLVSFFLYFSGIVGLYTFSRKKVFKRYRNIILVYHEICKQGAISKYAVSKENFEKQMDYIKRHFSAVSLDTILETNEGKPNVATDAVAITFDDGFKDNFLNAYPVLKKYQLRATIFLISGWIVHKKDMLNLEEINRMEKDGIDFGSHTVNHRMLSSLDGNAANDEICCSKTELEALLKKEMCYFAYPYGKKRHFTEEVKDKVKQAGYKAAFTTENREIDTHSDRFELGRFCIQDYPLYAFKTRVSGIFEIKFVFAIRKCVKRR
ncbi:MAG: hypothetical protein HW390_248 [Candidatus Brocadiaceae bacterium]|nr:hypothetical protein [Candidatus Brocadiaceae bacterium]